MAEPLLTSRDRAVRHVLRVALALHVSAALAKIVCGRLVHALSVEADGYHALTDGLGALVALIGVRLARRPPDAKHPYGHRKIELLTACAMGLSLLALSARLIIDALSHARLGTRHAPSPGAWPLGVMIASLLASAAISLYQSRRGRALSSAILLADSRHTRSDCWVSAGVLAGLILGRLGVPAADTLATVAVALVIARSSLAVLRENADGLTDRALIDPERVAQIAISHPDVLAAHSVRSRGTPSAIYIDLRLRLPRELTLVEVDRAIRQVTQAIRSHLECVVDVTISPEPIGGTMSRKHICEAHGRRHIHGPDCGHPRVPHDDHFDYLVGDHVHHVEGKRCLHRALTET